ncbi:carbonic anhydrase [Crinalium epipsammum PCC 9333]|uniref:carbonic anhydrase n=1 Tax=Crinalium epipsammum PCC 9333 TaxID=1173022 RepID=K9W2W7_9CYAN|nr:carbonic anhydrase [Crinalium epipsammum]AFZ14536.1 carbonic anhydrase [Crinalium epipsammum PCC 9333]
MTAKNILNNVSRRNIIKFGAAAIGTSVVTAGIGSKFLSTQPAVANNDLTPDEALERLMEGNQRFISGKSNRPHQTLKDLQSVSASQKPFAAILSCADSRVPSEILFDRGFGDLFICRVAGNVATPEEIGSLEFGTLVLGAKVLLVMGHKNCGAVDATIKGAQVPGQIASLLDAIKPALAKLDPKKAAQLEAGIKANVVYQVAKLQESPVISKLVNDGQLKIVGAYFDFDSGKISWVS